MFSAASAYIASMTAAKRMTPTKDWPAVVAVGLRYDGGLGVWTVHITDIEDPPKHLLTTAVVEVHERTAKQAATQKMQEPFGYEPEGRWERVATKHSFRFFKRTGTTIEWGLS